MANELSQDAREEYARVYLALVKKRLKVGDYADNLAWLVSEVERLMAQSLDLCRMYHEACGETNRMRSARDEAVATAERLRRQYADCREECTALGLLNDEKEEEHRGHSAKFYNNAVGQIKAVKTERDRLAAVVRETSAALLRALASRDEAVATAEQALAEADHFRAIAMYDPVPFGGVWEVRAGKSQGRNKS